MLHDHTDLRVRNLARTRPLYDALLPALGYTRVSADETCVYYHLPREDVDFFGITADENHRPNGTRIAFAASSREQVDELAALVKAAGARSFEPPHICLEYTEKYYAAFFEDADGNKLEICNRG
jgi:catechol 2,3-dioxygenase-like lactoylglutathione lyase family enzyme